MTSFYFLFNAPCPPSRSPLLFLIIYINSRMERLRVVVGTSNKKRKKKENRDATTSFVFNLFNKKKIMDHSTTFPIAFWLTSREPELVYFFSYSFFIQRKTRVVRPKLLDSSSDPLFLVIKKKNEEKVN